MGPMTGKVNCILSCRRMRVVSSMSLSSLFDTDETTPGIQFWALQFKRDMKLWDKSTVKDHWDDWGTSESNSRGEGRLRELGLFSLEKICGCGDLINVYKYLSEHQKIWVPNWCGQHDASLQIVREMEAVSSSLKCHNVLSSLNF